MPAREELLSLPVVVLASNPETILGDIFRINASVLLNGEFKFNHWSGLKLFEAESFYLI